MELIRGARVRVLRVRPEHEQSVEEGAEGEVGVSSGGYVLVWFPTDRWGRLGLVFFPEQLEVIG